MLQYRPVTEIIHKSKVSKNGEISGTPASKGIVSGEICFLEDCEDVQKFKKGTILLTYFTDADWVEAMINAKAIITSEGGFLCHTAIITRDLGTPCVAGIGENNLIALSKCKKVLVNGNNGSIKIF